MRKPVPSLGDDNTPLEKVHAFYSYWVRFESWRDFTLQADVHDLDTASCREEKRYAFSFTTWHRLKQLHKPLHSFASRWMMKENDKLIKNLKKDEYRRLNRMVETAMKLDPRLRRAKEVRVLVGFQVFFRGWISCSVRWLTNSQAEKEAKRQEELRRAEELRREQEERERQLEEERIRQVRSQWLPLLHSTTPVHYFLFAWVCCCCLCYGFSTGTGGGRAQASETRP